MLATRDRQGSWGIPTVGLGLVVAQLAYRAWVLVPAWFAPDDYELLGDARGRRLTVGYLLGPHDGHLIPVGRLLAWLVTRTGPVSWGAAATVTLVLQAMVGVTCLWMLVTLFGRRPAVLALLVLYLGSALTLPALVRWGAAVEQLPLQAVVFCSVASWVRYQRDRAPRSLAGTAVLTVVGLLCSPGALLVPPLLGFLSLAYFAEGSRWSRVVGVLVRERLAAAAGLLLVAGYLALHLSVPGHQRAGAVDLALLSEVARTLGSSFVSGVLGGPWRWAAPGTPPSQVAAPPAWTVQLAWPLLAVVVAWAALRRRRTLRAWTPLVAYLVVVVVVLAATRASTFGAVTAADLRYLTGTAAVATLSLGLAVLPLLGAEGQSSAARPDPLLRVRLPAGTAAAGIVVVTVSGLLSSTAFASYWHGHNASDAFVHRLRTQLAGQGSVDLVDATLPEEVVPSLSAPADTVRAMVALLGGRANFPTTTSRLGIVAPDGSLRTAEIRAGVTSQPGPRPDCGWPVTSSGRSIPLTGRAFDYDWWLRIGYLAPRPSRVQISAGDARVTGSLDAGLHSLFVHVRGSFDHVTLTGVTPGTRVCVDTVEVGTPTPGGYLL